MQANAARRVAVVTGAGSGIGRAIATTLAASGTVRALVLNDLPAGQEVVDGGLEATREAVASHGGVDVSLARVDVTDRRGVQRMMAQAVADHGRLDVAVSNAYFSSRAPFLELSLDDFQRTLDVTLVGAFNVVQSAAREMAKEETPQHHRKICIVSSVMAAHPYLIDTSAPYNAAKAALNNLAQSAASDLAQHRICVNCVAPGWIETPGETKFTPDWEEVDRQGRKSLPWGIGSVQDVANAADFLCSGRSDYMTGSVMTVDGGFGVSQRVPGLHDPIRVADRGTELS
jgi:glucose 1-dehydrogenase